MAEGAALTFTLDQRFPGKDHNIGRFRVSVSTSPEPRLDESLPANLRKILAVEPAKRSPQQAAELTAYYRGLDQELARLAAAVANNPKPFDVRLVGAQDLAWALMNTPAFLFNH
jgi:hypothetical protein